MSISLSVEVQQVQVAHKFDNRQLNLATVSHNTKTCALITRRRSILNKITKAIQLHTHLWHNATTNFMESIQVETNT
jgi:hypothetical protein